MLDIEHFSLLPTATTHDGQTTAGGADSIKRHSVTSIEAVAIFAGGIRARNEALQWAEYHQLIGAQHIWLYVNENWDYEDFSRFDRSYISWIPYNHTLKDSPNLPIKSRNDKTLIRNIGRLSAMNDALFRAKRLGLQWLINIDIDKYVFFNPRTKFVLYLGGWNSTSSPILVRYLEGLDQRIDTIFLNLIPFGNREAGPANVTLLINHVWRRNQLLKKAKLERFKSIVKVTAAPILYIHMPLGNDENFALVPPTRDVRINHYKRPSNGVFRGGWRAGMVDGKTVRKSQTARDSVLMDHFHDLVLEKYLVGTNTTPGDATSFL